MTMATQGTVYRPSPDFQREFDKTMRRRILYAGNELKRAVREAIATPTRTYGPSEPGEPPHRDTGQLHKSIFSRTGEDRGGPFVDVGTKLDYGVYHETTERPFLRPTLVQMEPRLTRILTGQEGV